MTNKKGDIHIKIEGTVLTLLEYTDMAYYIYFIYLDSRDRRCIHSEANKAMYVSL